MKDTNYQATQEVSNLNSPLFIKETEFLVKTVYTNKSGPRWLHSGELLQAFREEIIPILYKLSQKVEEEEILPKIFYNASITLV